MLADTLRLPSREKRVGRSVLASGREAMMARGVGPSATARLLPVLMLLCVEKSTHGPLFLPSRLPADPTVLFITAAPAAVVSFMKGNSSTNDSIE